MVLLCGCTSSERGIDSVHLLRNKIANANGCKFTVVITADYSNVIYTFKMICETDAIGDLTFEVIEPESIQGITGCVSKENGKLTFDDKVLLFATIAEGQLTPVSAPWVFMNALSGGYISGCTTEKEDLLVYIRDSYAENALKLTVRIVDDLPVCVEIYWNNQRTVTLSVEEFCFL